MNGPSSAVSNGPGSRAKNYHMTTAYKTIIWDSGNLEFCTISEGTGYSDKSDDAQMLLDWIEFSPHRAGLWVCGDNIAADLDGAPSGAALVLLTSYCGVDFVGNSYYDVSGTVNPRVDAAAEVTNPLWHTTWGDSFYALGGCPLVNEFDYLEKTAGGGYALRYPDVGGSPYYAGIYNTGINDGGYTIRTMWFGFSFMYIRDVEAAPPIARNEVFEDIIVWMVNSTRHFPPAGEDGMALVNTLS